jgi:hypothetical protein
LIDATLNRVLKGLGSAPRDALGTISIDNPGQPSFSHDHFQHQHPPKKPLVEGELGLTCRAKLGHYTHRLYIPGITEQEKVRLMMYLFSARLVLSTVIPFAPGKSKRTTTLRQKLELRATSKRRQRKCVMHFTKQIASQTEQEFFS